MVTTDSQILESLRLANREQLSSIVSALIMQKLDQQGAITLQDFDEKLGKLDFSDLVRDFTNVSNNDFAGIDILKQYIKTLKLPYVTYNAGGNYPTPLINLTGISNPKILTQSGGKNWQGFYGNISNVTTLEELEIVCTTSRATQYPIVLPALKNNLSLKKVTITGNGNLGLYTTDLVGGIQNLTSLEYLEITYFNTSNTPLKGVIDNILSSLKAQKQAGGLIKTIILTSTPAPTGGTSNSDYIYLTNNGVSVTLGTL